jgi:hypothetical protein
MNREMFLRTLIEMWRVAGLREENRTVRTPVTTGRDISEAVGRWLAQTFTTYIKKDQGLNWYVVRLEVVRWLPVAYVQIIIYNHLTGDRLTYQVAVREMPRTHDYYLGIMTQTGGAAPFLSRGLRGIAHPDRGPEHDRRRIWIETVDHRDGPSAWCLAQEAGVPGASCPTRGSTPFGASPFNPPPQRR